MLGSLEYPPIIVRESWTVRVVLILAAIAITIVLMLPGTPDLWSNQPVMTATLVLGIWSLTLWHLYKPTRLEIWPDKLVRRDFAGFRHTYAFADIDEFTVSYVGRGGMQAAFFWSKESSRRTKLAAVSEVLQGYDVALGNGWEMPVQDLVDLLNRTRLLPSAWR